jgi:restriction-modification enzyme MmeI-like protein
MALSWNEIKSRAVEFSKEWENETSEDAEAKSFLDEFFNVFGVSRRRIAQFEKRVKKQGDKDGFIDLLWKGVILIEMKSKGKDLDKAYKQATDYFPGLKEYDLPKYILVCDFEQFRLYDIEENTHQDFVLKDLYKNVKLFGFVLGYQTKTYKSEDPVNIEAAQRMGKLHDRLKEIGYDGHVLEIYLVRLLFCLFAEDTTIFDKQLFQDYIEQKTNEDGSDLAAHLAQLFAILNTAEDKRLKNIDEQLNQFPYVNGKLFAEQLPYASFDSTMRNLLIDCCALDWSRISPAIFGSLFQSVMDAKQRRNLGAHYTSEKNILKLIKPLFLDELQEEFESVRNNKNKLIEFHKKISQLKFLDPACGCGNFLIITYRELRLLEIEILRALNKNGQTFIDVKDIIWLDIDMMYGIEYEEFPARIAEVAMYLIDHQMNMAVSNEFGQYFRRLPLKKSATIINGNALRIDWQSLLNSENSINTYAEHANIYIVKEPKAEYKTLNVQAKTFKVHKGEIPVIKQNVRFDYILGNPPFLGHHLQSKEQKADLHYVLKDIKAAGVMDYVTAWYYKASEYLKQYNNQGNKIRVAFVSTNSITQGEQVGILWRVLLNNYDIKIHFAHRTFKWSNEAKGNAAVFCVIIGFSNYDIREKKLFEYETVKSEPHEISAKNINPYLVDYKDLLIDNVSNPICKVPKMQYGSKPSDGGHFLLTEEEKDEILKKEPLAKKFIKKFISGREFLHNENRYCLWLVDASPDDLKRLPEVRKRVELVKEFREKSKADSTKNFPFHTLFRQVTQPKSDYIIFPSTTSETRKYLPLGFLSKDIIISNASYAIPNATIYHFGVLTSMMHMSWMRYTCGRLKSDYRYSNTIVYNNYPWPESPNDKQIKAIEVAAKKVLDIRAEFPKSSLADLYDPLTMPPVLVKAHNELDKAVDIAYRSQPFISEAKRMEFLFELYEKYTADLFTKEKVKKPKNK